MPGTKHHVEIEGRELALTNLEKVLYPGNGFTKAHIIDYYMRAAPWLLPHYLQRPVTLHRFPDGVTAQSFYEKDAPKFTPAWVETTLVPRSTGGKPIRYILINNLATLIWTQNIASVELHPFLHLAAHLGHPTSIVFDLDPGEGVTLQGCAQVARLLRALLAHNSLDCYPKLSGSKGIQIYVPLNAAVTYEAAREAALTAARILEREHPRLVIADMAKELRRGKVFIDWSQNSDFKTTSGVYSLRAKADVPYVSAPITWAEVEALEQGGPPLRLAPDQVLARLERQGDLFEPLLRLKQKLGTIQAPAPPKPAAFLEPMLLEPTTKLPEGPEWAYEIKLDGFRALASNLDGALALRSRNDKDLAARFPNIARALTALPAGTIVDGEIVALDDEGRPSFNRLQQGSGSSIVYYVFDVLTLRGRSLLREPLSKRRDLLEREVVPHLHEPFRLSPILDVPLADLLQSVKANRLEGLVAKRRDSLYEPGERTGAWRKMRVNNGQELVIGGYTLGTRTFDALIAGYYAEDGRLLYAARTRSGFTPALREAIFAKLKPLAVDACPFANLPEKTGGRWGQGLTAEKMKDCRWVKPELVGVFEFVEWTPEGHLRHSSFSGLRDDIGARTVRRQDGDTVEV